jgi:hypothetical protein
MNLKSAVLHYCRELVAGRLDALQQTLSDLAQSVSNETKSTAGDKYETGRAMLHIEQDNIRGQISVTMSHKAVLDSIDPEKHAPVAGPGSLLLAGGQYYFLSTALGKFVVDGLPVIALSPGSPLGARLIGRRAGDTVDFNGNSMLIEACQ